jgi:hypothetical protein
MGGAFLFLCKFFCKKISEFRFRRKANQIRNRAPGRNSSSVGAYSNSPSLRAPIAVPTQQSFGIAARHVRQGRSLGEVMEMANATASRVAAGPTDVAQSHLDDRAACLSRGRRRPPPRADIPARNGRGVITGSPTAGRSGGRLCPSGIAGVHHRKHAPPRRAEPVSPRERASARDHWPL